MNSLFASTARGLEELLKTELENLLDKRKITYCDPQPTGRKRAKGQWPERLLISFK